MHQTEPDIGWSWMVAVGSFGCHLIHGLFQISVGITQVTLLDYYKADVLTTSWTGSLFLGLSSLAGPISSIISNKWSCRVALMTGSLMMTSGFLLTALMPSIEFVVVTFGVISGTGAGITYNASVVVIGFNFKRKLNFASGISTSGAGIGALVLAPLLQLSYELQGYTYFWVMCAGISLHHCVFGALFFPSSLEIQRKGELKQQHMPESQGRIQMSESLRFLKNKALISICLCMLLVNIGIYVMYLHYASYIVSLGRTRLQASYLLSTMGICACFVRILLGLSATSDNIDEFVIFSGCFSVLGVTTVLLPLYGKFYSGQVFYAITLGCYGGSCYVLLNTITVAIVGINDLATGYAYQMFVTGIGCLIGPLLPGLVIDSGGSYEHSFIIAGILIIIGSLFGWLSGALVDNSRGREKYKTTCVDIIIREDDKLPQSTETLQKNLNKEDTESHNIDYIGQELEDSGQCTETLLQHAQIKS